MWYRSFLYLCHNYKNFVVPRIFHQRVQIHAGGHLRPIFVFQVNLHLRTFVPSRVFPRLNYLLNSVLFRLCFFFNIFYKKILFIYTNKKNYITYVIYNKKKIHNTIIMK